MQVNMLDAKTHLASYVKKLETHEEDEIILARYGIPVARLTRITPKSSQKRIGVAAGKFDIPDDFDELDNAVEEMFLS